MLPRFCFLGVASAITIVGDKCQVSARSEQADTPVLVVVASFPGANAIAVADTVAAPLEKQINGVKGMVRIESKSGNDGTYIAHLYFEPKMDPRSATQFVQKRVALATPLTGPQVLRGAGHAPGIVDHNVSRSSENPMVTRHDTSRASRVL